MPRVECGQLPQTEFTRLFIQDRLTITERELQIARECIHALENAHTAGMFKHLWGEVTALRELLKDLPNIKKRIDRQRRRERKQRGETWYSSPTTT